MILVITKNTVKNREAYLPLAKAFAADAAYDRGCRMMEVCVDPETENEVVFVSKWETKEDFQAHIQGESFRKHIPGMGPYYVAGTDTVLEIQSFRNGENDR